MARIGKRLRKTDMAQLWSTREKKIRWLAFLALVLFFVTPGLAFAVSTTTILNRYAGKVVKNPKGGIWYVEPASKNRYPIMDAEQTFAAIQKAGTGIKHAELAKYLKVGFPKRLAGKILIDAEANGAAYYVKPANRKGIALKSAYEGFLALRDLSVNISTTDLVKIPIAGATPPAQPKAPVLAKAPQYEVSSLEKQVLDGINQHRQSKGLKPLAWNDTIAAIAKKHSQNMANKSVPLGHSGFQTRVDTIFRTIKFWDAAENVGYNNDASPVQAAIKGWLASPGHKANIEVPGYSLTGVGIAYDGQGYFFTQLFVQPQ